MSYYQNGQPYYGAASQQPPPPSNQYQDGRYARRVPSFENGNQAQYGTNGGGGQHNYGYSGMDRSNSVAARQQQELFIQAGSPPLSSHQQPAQSPTVTRYPTLHSTQSSQASHQTYNPQHFAMSAAPPVSMPDFTTYGGVSRQPQEVLPYNPAAYADSNVGRQNSTASSYGRYSSPASYNQPSPLRSPSSAAYPSPPIPQHEQFARTNSQYGYNRTGTQTSMYPPQSGSAPPSQIYSPPGAPETSASWNTSPQRHSTVSGPYYQGRQSDPAVTPHHSLPSPPPGYPSQTGRHGSDPNPQYPPHNPLPTPPGPPPPPHAPQRTASRPLPTIPPAGESDSDNEYFATRPNGGHRGHGGSNELFDIVEGQWSSAGNTATPSPRIQVNQPVNGDQDRASYYTPLGAPNYEGRNGATVNGGLSPNIRQDQRYNYSDESDVEAAAGLEAMRMADEQEAADEARRQSGGSALFTSYTSARPTTSDRLEPAQPTHQEPGSDSDYGNIDMGIYGGGYAPEFSYGGAPEELAAGHGSISDTRSHPASSSGSMRRSETSSQDYDYETSLHPFPPFQSNARVDTFGTGGLAEPSAHLRRPSFDEGDEAGFIDRTPAPAGEPAEMFYHPGMSTSRPLPPPPASPSTRYPQSVTGSIYGTQAYRNQNAYQPARGPYPTTPDAMQTPGGSLVPRSTSLLNHSNTPQAMPPIRSKTDAEERRLRQQQLRTSQFFGSESGGDTLTPPSGSVPIDLPALPAGKRFNPAKLTAADFKKCKEPWALSSIIGWLKTMTEGEQDLKEHGITEGLNALFTHKVPTMNVADAETLSARVVQDMYRAGTLVHEEEWLKFSSETMTGVIFQLTGAGCYAPRLHLFASSGRCYAHHCQRTVRKIDLQAAPSLRADDDWATYYKIKKEDVEGVNKKEVERQNILHEIVQGEDKYMESLDVLRYIYRDALLNAQIIGPNKVKKFVTDVFGKVDAVKRANEDYLLPQLKYRQQEQGPWVAGFSDIFREWIRKAKAAYIEYAASFPRGTYLVRQEAERNMLFRTFLDQARANPKSNKLSWDTYLKAPITRLQHYGLLLNTVLKRSTIDNEEKKNLQVAIDEIKKVTMECDAQVAEMSRKVDLSDLQRKLIIRPGFQRVELNLDHLGRELIFKGDLQRLGNNKFTWLETHALLFDHYLVLAKTINHKDGDGDRYDVSKPPIPMDLLMLESSNDDPVVPSRVRGIAEVKPSSQRNISTDEGRLGRINSSQSPGPGSLTHTPTQLSVSSKSSDSSSKTMVTTTVLNPDSSKDEKILYPFRVKYLGKESYTLFAPSAGVRSDWVDKIIEAKTKHAKALFTQNAEPFRLRVMADAAFAYDGGSLGQTPITIKGTPLDRAIEEVERMFVNSGRPGPICRAKVNCATAFNQPYGKQMVAIGTDFGVYISEMDNPRGWSRAIPIPKVTQIAVLEEFSLFLLISDKSLIAYHLDVVCPASGVAPQSDSARRAPQKLSGSRDVSFFATGRMKDRTLVFYMKKQSLSSTFKVLEPVFQKSTEKKSRFLRSGRTEFFREFDEFYIPTNCYGINLFHSSLAVSTEKGFEVLTLDKKQPWSVPDLKGQAVASIASRLGNQTPLGMFRLSETEFLLVYEECAVYVNKHGEVSRSVVMEFVGRARQACLYGPYVLLFDSDFVEVRNAMNGRLRQVIAGRDVRCLDDGLNGGSAASMMGGAGGLGGGSQGMGRTVKVGLQHPEYERNTVVVELVLNEGLKE